MACSMPGTRTYTADNFDYSLAKLCYVRGVGAQAFVPALRSRAISSLEGRGDSVSHTALVLSVRWGDREFGGFDGAAAR